MNSLDFENWRASVKHRQAARRSEAANEKGGPNTFQPELMVGLFVPAARLHGRAAHWKEMEMTHEKPLYIEACFVCGNRVDTREVEDGGDPDGCQLSNQSWVCSSECWDIATGQKSTVTVIAGLMFDNVEGKPAFEMHSGKDSMSIAGTATITLDKDGAVEKIIWRPER